MKQACDMGTNWPEVQFSFKLLHPRLQTAPVQAAGHSLMELTEPHHQQKKRGALSDPPIGRALKF